ncbi:MAG: PhoH family protein [Methylococcales bacterium]|jgi:phosphate starvation-inducible protein PhoH and related proteins|nr:PhoH family protein [Methylococcales bacterium]MBT7410524.1 PhoH family protein [Methylococcales bacterium]
MNSPEQASALSTIEITLQPTDNTALANLCGQFDEHLRQIEKKLGIEIQHRDINFKIIGQQTCINNTAKILKKLYQQAFDETLKPSHIHLMLQELEANDFSEKHAHIQIRTKRGVIKARGKNQQKYVDNIMSKDINFGIGPAGTGKTYLAVACAVELLEKGQVRKMVLTRPAVEAGEKLGFLPGDLAQKVDPYLRPLYDALYEMLGYEKVAKLMERNVIEVAPLAYMRGRTLNEAFVILDEAQNTTIEQMKMFLTRIGFGSQAIITGDTTQIDLPKHIHSGLLHATDVLHHVKGIAFTHFETKDIVRHSLVQHIINAYDDFESKSL